MKVKELIAKLTKLDPELRILCYAEEEGLVAEGHLFRLLDVEDVSISEGEMLRGSDGLPSIKFGSGQHSTRIAMLNVCGEF